MVHKVHGRDERESVEAYFTALMERRRARLKDLIASAGGQNEAIERLGKSQSLLSRLSRGTKPIGEALARDLEKAAGKPFGWMDADDERPAATKNNNKSLPQDAYARKLMALWDKLTVADQRELYGRAAGLLQRGAEVDAVARKRA